MCAESKCGISYLGKNKESKWKFEVHHPSRGFLKRTAFFLSLDTYFFLTSCKYFNYDLKSI